MKKIMVNGVIRDMTPEEIAELETMQLVPNRKEQIVSAIRERYSVDDELAILRQRDSKPDEFDEYFKFVEDIKQNLKENDSTSNWHENTEEEAEAQQKVETTIE